MSDIADLIRVIESWYEPSPDDAPPPPPEVVAFLRELVVGLRELSAGDTAIDAVTLGNIISGALGEMQGDWS
jgi:hypothetical protein